MGERTERSMFQNKKFIRRAIRELKSQSLSNTDNEYGYENMEIETYPKINIKGTAHNGMFSILKEGSEMDIFVFAIYNERVFHFQPSIFHQIFLNLDEEIKKASKIPWVGFNITKTKDDDSAELRVPFYFQDELTGFHLRAIRTDRTLSTELKDKDHCEILCIDIGETRIIEKEKLLPLRPHLCTIPALGAMGILDNEDSKDEICQLMKMTMLGKTITTEIQSVQFNFLGRAKVNLKLLEVN